MATETLDLASWMTAAPIAALGAMSAAAVDVEGNMAATMALRSLMRSSAVAAEGAMDNTAVACFGAF